MSTVLAVLASGCYSPDFGPYLSAVRLDVEAHRPVYIDVGGTVVFPFDGTAVFTATLFPDDVNWTDKVEVEWTTPCGGRIIDFHGTTPTRIDGNGRTSSVMVMAISPDDVGFVIVTVTPIDPRVPPPYASRRVIVRPEEFEEEI